MALYERLRAAGAWMPVIFLIAQLVALVARAGLVPGASGPAGPATQP